MAQQSPFPSGIARTVDPRVPSNRNILLLSTAVAVVMGLYRFLGDLPLEQVAVWAVASGLYTFLTWSMGRELDPDHTLSAFVGAAVMGVALFVLPLPRLLMVGVMLIVLRIITRTTGLPPRPTDIFALIVLVVVMVAIDGVWLLGLVAALALLLNERFSHNGESNDRVFALALVVLTAVAAVFRNTPALWLGFSPLWALVGLVVAVAYGVIVWREPRRVAATGDFTGEPLSPRRILAGRLLALGAAAGVLLLDGTWGFYALLPVWAAMLGVIVRYIQQNRR